MSDLNPQFPNYSPPQGLSSADKQQAGPLTKMIGKMIGPKLKPKLLGRMKGIKADQSVHVGHKKVKFY